jgi:tRNA pseudouridine38-40 synthase
MRYLFEIQYNGSHYIGWQTQQQGKSIQSVVEDSMSKLVREPVEIVGSGRTDAGVHCEQQFFHVDLQQPVENLEQLLFKLNAFLPKDIYLPSVRIIKDDVHARYTAKQRVYNYRITTIKNPFLEGLALHYFKPVDVALMNEAAATMLGEQDFESFSKVKTNVKHFLCDVTKAEWREDGERMEFVIAANRFLRGMVRATVGTLLDVGTGKLSVEEFKNIIHHRDRRRAGANVPPYGLYLVEVKYPENIYV